MSIKNSPVSYDMKDTLQQTPDIFELQLQAAESLDHQALKDLPETGTHL